MKKASGGALFWEGWMVHSTDKEPLNEKRYYWRVDASYVKTNRIFLLIYLFSEYFHCIKDV